MGPTEIKSENKQVEPLIKSFLPPDELKKTFFTSFFGSVMGQTVLLVGLLAVYFALVAFLYSSAMAPLLAFRKDVGPLWFWIVFAAPLACILVTSALPTGWRAQREHRLRESIIGGQPKPGYFRLQPYKANDHEAFNRLDGADRDVLNWLKSATGSIFYLSGASRVGKSSLLAAGVLPTLREADWNIIETRIFGNAVERVRSALADANQLFDRKPARTLSLSRLLKSAAEASAKHHSGPLLLVIDQFEEFLTLNEAKDREEFTAALIDLSKGPVHGLRLMIVFRSDYQSLIFKLGLPRLLAGDNWYELAPYTRNDAESFLKGSGRELSASQ